MLTGLNLISAGFFDYVLEKKKKKEKKKKERNKRKMRKKEKRKKKKEKRKKKKEKRKLLRKKFGVLKEKSFEMRLKFELRRHQLLVQVFGFLFFAI